MKLSTFPTPPDGIPAVVWRWRRVLGSGWLRPLCALIGLAVVTAGPVGADVLGRGWGRFAAALVAVVAGGVVLVAEWVRDRDLARQASIRSALTTARRTSWEDF
jgi:hypothetical protein